jgi:hypothetical protein
MVLFATACSGREPGHFAVLGIDELSAGGLAEFFGVVALRRRR